MNYRQWLSRIIFASLVAVCLATFGLRSSFAQPLSLGRAVPHELLVRFKLQISKTQRAAVLNARAARVIRYFAAVDIHHLRLPDDADVDEALQAFLSDPNVASAQPNYIRHVVAVAPPNDPAWLIGYMWGLEKIQMQPVWLQYTTGSSDVVVADIDTGADYTHPDLVANMWHNPSEIAGNGVDDDQNGYVDDVYGIDTYNHDSDPMDDYGHGTHTAGIMSAAGDNGIGVVGVNWNAKIIACKFIGSDGSGTDAGAIECFNYVVALKQHGVNIRATNNSWGDARGSDPFPQALKDAIDAAGNAGIVNVFAAGNGGTNTDAAPFDPASFDSPSIISVAASDIDDQRASFSNYGPISVDLAAPGVNIDSTYWGDYGFLSGTSMAAPHVAGAVAILAAFDPALTASAMKSLILNNVDVLPNWSGLTATGGRLNVLKAMMAIDQLPTISLVTPVNNATYASPASFNLSATATDKDGSVTLVTFYANGTAIGTSKSSPYSFSWSNIPAGSYTLTAVATDNFGARATSDPVTINVSDTEPTDSDADGIADSWEMRWFGNLETANAISDYDGDGLSDLQEYLSGTNPKDPTSALRASAVFYDTLGFHLSAKTVSSYLYQLERSADFSSWEAVGGVVSGTDSATDFVDNAPPLGPAFYRVVVSSSSP
jgi:serine protease